MWKFKAVEILLCFSVITICLLWNGDSASFSFSTVDSKVGFRRLFNVRAGANQKDGKSVENSKSNVAQTIPSSLTASPLMSSVTNATPTDGNTIVIRVRRVDGSTRRIQLSKRDTIDNLLTALTATIDDQSCNGKVSEGDDNRLLVRFPSTNKVYQWKELSCLFDPSIKSSTAIETLQLRHGDWIILSVPVSPHSSCTTDDNVGSSSPHRGPATPTAVEAMVSTNLLEKDSKKESNNYIQYPSLQTTDHCANPSSISTKSKRSDKSNRQQQSINKRLHRTSTNNKEDIPVIKRESILENNQRNAVLVSIAPSLSAVINRLYNKGGFALLFGKTSSAKLSKRIQAINKLSTLKKQKTVKDLKNELDFVKHHEVVAAYEVDGKSLSFTTISLQSLRRVYTMAEECGLQLIGIAVSEQRKSNLHSNVPRPVWTTGSLIAGLKCHKLLSAVRSSRKGPLDIVVLSVGDVANVKQKPQVAVSSSNRRNHHKTDLKEDGKDSMVVEAFRISAQALSMFNDTENDLDQYVVNGTHVRSITPVRIGSSKVVTEIDCNLFAIPLAIEKLDLNTNKKVYQQHSVDSGSKTFLSVFPSNHELQSSEKIRKVATDYMLKIMKRLGNIKNQRSQLDKDTIDRLQDLHLLEYLRKYFSASTFSSLCVYLALQRNPSSNRSPASENHEIFLPSSVQMEASLLLQSFSTDNEEDNE